MSDFCADFFCGVLFMFEFSSSDLEKIASGRRINDKMLDVSADQALAIAMRLGDEIGRNYLQIWKEFGEEKLKKCNESTIEKYDNWLNEAPPQTR